jgi:hypothetical protein
MGEGWGKGGRVDFTMNTNISDFTDAEQKLVSASLFERYGKLVPLQLADSELQLDAVSEKLTLCPTLYWAERGAQFVVCKVAADRYRCQFFYSGTEQYGTGQDEYNSLGDCVVTLAPGSIRPRTATGKHFFQRNQGQHR